MTARTAIVVMYAARTCRAQDPEILLALLAKRVGRDVAGRVFADPELFDHMRPTLLKALKPSKAAFRDDLAMSRLDAACFILQLFFITAWERSKKKSEEPA